LRQMRGLAAVTPRWHATAVCGRNWNEGGRERCRWSARLRLGSPLHGAPFTILKRALRSPTRNRVGPIWLVLRCITCTICAVGDCVPACEDSTAWPTAPTQRLVSSLLHAITVLPHGYTCCPSCHSCAACEMRRIALTAAALAVAAAVTSSSSTLRGAAAGVEQHVLSAAVTASEHIVNAAHDPKVSLKTVVISQNMANEGHDRDAVMQALQKAKVPDTATSWLAAVTGADILIAAIQEKGGGGESMDLIHICSAPTPHPTTTAAAAFPWMACRRWRRCRVAGRTSTTHSVPACGSLSWGRSCA